VAGRLRGIDPEDVSVGAEVEVGFDPGPGGFAIPSFTVPASGGASDVAVGGGG
jgi:uncharacterized protein